MNNAVSWVNFFFFIITAVLPQIVYAATDLHKFGSMQDAVQAARSAKTENDEFAALNDLANHKLATREDILALYDAMRDVESKVGKGMTLQEAQPRLQKLSASLAQAKNPQFHATISDLLDQEANRHASPFKIAPWDAAATNLAASRLLILMQIAGEGGNKSSLPTLRKLAKRQDVIGQAAIKSIAQIGQPEDLDYFIGEIEKNPRMIGDLGGFGPMLIDRIMHEVDSSVLDEATKNALIGRLGQAAGPAAIPKYRILVKHKDKRVAEQAAYALKNSLGGGDGAVALEMLQSENSNVRFDGLTALDEKAWTAQYAEILIDLLKNDPDDGVRSHAAHILGQRQIVAAIPALRNALKDRSGFVRSAADGALKTMSETSDRKDSTGR